MAAGCMVAAVFFFILGTLWQAQCRHAWERNRDRWLRIASGHTGEGTWDKIVRRYSGWQTSERYYRENYLHTAWCAKLLAVGLVLLAVYYALGRDAQ